MGVTSFLLLSSLGLVITSQAQDCPKPVPGPNMNLRGEDILLETFPDGKQVSFSCDIGYRAAGGSPSITCTAGSWSPVQLKCEKRNCGSAGKVENGNIDYPTGTEFGGTAVITCDDGYLLVGKREIICGNQGWLDRLPVCEVVTCDPPRSIVDGSFSPVNEIYEYREVVVYRCKTDYTLNGSAALSCSDDRKFHPDPPKCTRVQCQDLEIENADWVGGSRPPHRHRSTITFQCRSGFTMKGSPTVTCDINSRWSPAIPQCTKTPSPPKPSPPKPATTTTISPSGTNKPTGTSDPTDPDGNGKGTDKTSLITALLVTFAALCAAIIGGVCCWKKRGAGRRNTDKEATNGEEDVALR